MADGPIRDFRGTEDGEWYSANGDFASIAGADAVPQGIRVRLGMILSECYLNEDVGVDYLNTILVKGADPLVVRSLLQEPIANTPDVTNVVGAQLENDENRQASIEYTCDTVYSEEPFSGTAEVP